LTMDTLQKVARRHGFVCLLHEKPFAGVNGSGKHNNWSMATDTGVNLLDPGATPHENMVFLVMLCAVLRAVDQYATLLRASVANAGNDHRLGANEAPPAIVSIFLGEQLTDIFEQLATGGAKSSRTGGQLKLGVSTLPHLPKDSTDRNRTSPFAFTGNKFEFRMVGSSQSISGPAFTLNTIVADALSDIADELEKAGDVRAATQKILKDIATKHARIVFNGDNYSEQWVTEAARRGLPNIRSTVESLKTIATPENFALFSRHGVLSENELRARTEILFEVYSRQINVEALTMLTMARRQILPACCEYSARLGAAVAAVANAGVQADTQKALLARVCALIDTLETNLEALDQARIKASVTLGYEQQAESYRTDVVPAMQALRTAADELETLVDATLWPLPTCAEMLFVR
jgi:glutamine synthetase